MKFYYEILLSGSKVEKSAWQEFLSRIQKLIGKLKGFVVSVLIDQSVIHYYLTIEVKLESSLNIADFLLKPLSDEEIYKLSSLRPQNYKYRGLKFLYYEQSLADLIIANKIKARTIYFAEVTRKNQLSKPHLQIFYQKNSQTYVQTIENLSISTFLAINFEQNKQFYFEKIPKILEVKKLMPLLQRDGEKLLEANTFPVTDQTLFLSHQNYDFYKHSLVIGSSGSGKSHFLGLLIRNIYLSKPQNFKIILIDPHDALRDILGEIDNQTIIDFQDDENSVGLFDNFLEQTNVYVELMLTLFKSLIKTNYNPFLERLLRFSIYILCENTNFNLENLRKLLLDTDYRQDLIKQANQISHLTNVISFFLQDFSEIKNQHYQEAFAPIIALIDELQMTPIFRQTKFKHTFSETITNSFLTIYSLNRNILGEQTVQTIAGLIMQQIFTYATIKDPETKIMVIIDEVAVIENPILPKFLSELRKYNVFAILAGQYFTQISSQLRDAIFANVSNFYNFRVSEADAKMLAKNINIKIKNGAENPELMLLEKQQLLSNLKDRECLVRIMANGALIPVFKAKTVEFSPPRIERKRHALKIQEKLQKQVKKYDFIIDTDINLKDLMQTTSSSRRKI